MNISRLYIFELWSTLDPAIAIDAQLSGRGQDRKHS